MAARKVLVGFAVLALGAAIKASVGHCVLAVRLSGLQR